MLTPQEVSERAFQKASFGGYNMGQVDEFLDVLTGDYSALYSENAVLKSKMKVLVDKVEEYRSTEDAMRQTLLTAQKMAAKLVQEAQTEKDNMLAEARAETAQEVARLADETKAAEQKLAMAQEKLADFIRRSDELCQAQSAFLQTLPELELVPAQPSADAAPSDAVVSGIEQDILTQYEAQAPQQEAAAEEHDAKLPPVDGSAAPNEFAFDLGELKFGRNYGGKE